MTRDEFCELNSCYVNVLKNEKGTNMPLPFIIDR